MKPDEEPKNIIPQQSSESPINKNPDTSLNELKEQLASVSPDQMSAEMIGELEKLPPEVKRFLSMSISMERFSSGSPIVNRINEGHINSIIENNEKEAERDYQKFKSSEATKRFTIGSLLGLVLMVLVYAGVTQDKQLSEKIITAGITALGGFGAGL